MCVCAREGVCVYARVRLCLSHTMCMCVHACMHARTHACLRVCARVPGCLRVRTYPDACPGARACVHARVPARDFLSHTQPLPPCVSVRSVCVCVRLQTCKSVWLCALADMSCRHGCVLLQTWQWLKDMPTP